MKNFLQVDLNPFAEKIWDTGSYERAVFEVLYSIFLISHNIEIDIGVKIEDRCFDII